MFRCSGSNQSSLWKIHHFTNRSSYKVTFSYSDNWHVYHDETRNHGFFWKNRKSFKGQQKTVKERITTYNCKGSLFLSDIYFLNNKAFLNHIIYIFQIMLASRLYALMGTFLVLEALSLVSQYVISSVNGIKFRIHNTRKCECHD